jgi:hypothetical protein
VAACVTKTTERARDAEHAAVRGPGGRGGYLAVHGAQKLFGAFGGPGLEKAAAGFERIGLAPGRQMAALARAAELGGGLLTVAGAADPAGPLAIIGTMAVASATHRTNGPLARDGGFELPLTNLAAASAGPDQTIPQGGQVRFGLPGTPGEVQEDQADRGAWRPDLNPADSPSRSQN